MGGTSVTTPVQKNYGDRLGPLEIPTKTGMLFDGWYTDPSSGTKVTGNTTVTGSTTYYAHWFPIICEPATTLHTESTVSYGTIPNTVNIQTGFAYDCDVNNDGTYDSETERFYYVTSDGDNSILIYYTNMNDQTLYKYDIDGDNWYGPRTGYQYLPSTTTWSNPGLIATGTRSIVAENGNGSTSGGTIQSFTYTDKAARFLTYQEMTSVCGNTGVSSLGYLRDNNWLMENIGYYEKDSGTRSSGYWLETSDSNSDYMAWAVGGDMSLVGRSSINMAIKGVRPVITVLTSNISN